MPCCIRTWVATTNFRPLLGHTIRHYRRPIHSLAQTQAFDWMVFERAFGHRRDHLSVVAQAQEGTVEPGPMSVTITSQTR